MPGVMDIKHLLCNPYEPYSTTTGVAAAAVKTQEPMVYYKAMYEESDTRNHFWFDPSMNTTAIRTCRSNSSHSILSSGGSNVSPLYLPPTLVQSRKASDASLATPESPRDWPAYPLTPRDDELIMPKPYFRMATPPTNLSSPRSTRCRAPSSRRSRTQSSPSSTATTNAPVQTRMAWTPTEDDLLQQGYDEGLSWAMISTTYLPHRSRGCCWGRFKTLQSKNMVDLKRQNARLFRRPWKSIHSATKYH